MRNIVVVFAFLVLGATGCEHESSPPPTPLTLLTCAGQIVTSVEACAQAMADSAAQYQQRMNELALELTRHDFPKPGQTTVAEMIVQAERAAQAKTRTLSQMIVDAQAANAQMQAAAQAPALTESVEGQRTLAQVYGQMAAINQRMTERMREEAQRSDEAYRQMEARREQMRVDEIDRLRRQADQARRDAAYFQDQMAEEARRSAEAEEIYGG